MGHLRFATSSRNVPIECHPHEWGSRNLQNTTNQYSYDNSTHVWTSRKAWNGVVVTHNGDFDGVRLYDNMVTQSALANYLNCTLHTSVDVGSDSAKIAGWFTLMSTRGSWYKSARKGWAMGVAKHENDVCGGREVGAERGGKGTTAPGRGVVRAWEEGFEEVWERWKGRVRGEGAEEELKGFEKEVWGVFETERGRFKIRKWTKGQVKEFVSTTVTAFLTSDLMSTMSSFLRVAQGSFGIAVSSGSESTGVVLAAMGQPMTIAWEPKCQAVLYGSEGNAVKVPVREDGKGLHFKYDLDDNIGEVVRVGPDNGNNFWETVCFGPGNSAVGGVSSPVRLNVGGGVMLFDGLGGNQGLHEVVEKWKPIESRATVQTGDIVGKDIQEIPGVIKRITREWSREDNPNRETADDFFYLLADSVRRHNDGKGRRGIDLLVTGIESSLWVGEQFAADLAMVLPGLRVECVSSNKLLGALEEVPRMIHFCGYNRIRGDEIRRDRPVVLCISQSGQTFATLHCTRQLLCLLSSCDGDSRGNLFILTGEKESKMKDAVMEGGGGVRRCMHNFSGTRLAEPATVAVCAMHATLSEFLLMICQYASLTPFPTKLSVGREDIIDFRDLLDDGIEGITDIIIGDAGVKLKHQGETWAKHITESWRVMVLSGTYILASVISGYPLFYLVIVFPFESPTDFLVYLARVLDALLYIFLPKFLSYFFRYMESRTLLARHGKRTLVICDVPYVQKNLENYVSKMFALSYSFLGLEVHGVEAHDDMVHRFTHRVARGVLMALGRPDGRILSLMKTEQTIMLAAKQAAFIENMGVGPEIFTLGHNNVQSSIAANHVCIKSVRRKFLSESLYEAALNAQSGMGTFTSEEFEAVTTSILNSMHTAAVKLGAAYPRSLCPVGIIYGGDDRQALPSVYEEDDISIASSIKEMKRPRAMSDDHAEEILAMTVNKSVQLPPPEESPMATKKKASKRKSWLTPTSKGDSAPSEEMYQDPLKGSKHATPKLSLDARYAFASKLPQKIRRKLDKCQPIEHLFESRVASFERYVGFLVTFHSMADHASKPWLLPSWDISRSQSNLRVATTACPVSVEEDEFGEDFTIFTNDGSLELDMSKHVIEENKRQLSVDPEGGGILDTKKHYPASIVATDDEEIEIGEVDFVGSNKGSKGLGGGMKRILSLPKKMNKL